MRSLSATAPTLGSHDPKPPDGAALRPRVLMLGMGWFPSSVGGLDRYFRSLLEGLPEASAVVLGPATGAPASLLVASRADRPLPIRLLAYWLAAQRGARHAEIVDAHFALYAAVPLLLGALRSRPSVFHFQGPWAEENVASGDSSRVRFALRRALERAVLRRVDAHVVASRAFRRLLVERYRVRPWEVHVLSAGVALDTFTPGDRAAVRERMGIATDAFVAVCARRLVPRMGIDVLFDAWSQIGDTLPAGSVLLLVGEGPLHDELAARAARAPLAGHVRVLGRVSDADLIDAYRAADVAAVPTIAIEGFGLVVLEAAACGTPSIVSDVGGLPEVALPLDASLVLAPGDSDALGARLAAAATGALPTRADTRRYAESYSSPALVERHRQLYRRVAAGARDQRRRVVYLDHVARLSGGEIALLRLLPHLDAVNAHVILAEDGPLADRLTSAGISVEVLAMAASTRDLRRDAIGVGGGSATAALDTLAYVARLTWRLHELRADLVHTNSLKSGVYGALAAKAAGVPVVWHVRDRIAEDYIPKPAVRLVRTLVRRLADGVVANSAATLDTLSAPRRGRVHCVIPDSVELPEHAPARTPGPTTFGMLGRLAPWKGQDLFLRAFARAFPGGAERAIVVGAPMFGEEAYEHRLRELVSQLELGDRVELRGFREDIWRELASLDVLVHASLTAEPFGQVVLEGMAAGLAVIAPDEGGPLTLIDDGVSGRLFRARDTDSLAGVMRALRDDPQERERLGASARQEAQAYDPDRIAEQLERVYDQVLGESREGEARSRGELT
jgi:glycosyltransferase involved in cell wall biosynthesis